MRRSRNVCTLLLALSFLFVVSAAETAWSQNKKKSTRASAAAKKKSGKKKKSAPRIKLPDLKTPEDKLRFLELIRWSMPTRTLGRKISYASVDLDKSLKLRINAPQGQYAPIINDEAFIRRASLDLTGKLPTAIAIRRFVADEKRRKRRALVDRLLETDDYARKWARYWRSVVFHNTVANKNRIDRQVFEDWLAEQFKQNVPWDRIVAEMVSATPKRSKQDKKDFGQKYGPNNFVLACGNKPTEIAAQTARIFMGISIQCAECHDHPFDQWKREQFHELAAFFSRGKYYMTDQQDPAKKTEVKARFLLGEKPPEYLKPDQRRVYVAACLIYNPDNYWFARAYVNRIWNELIGDGFYSVDSLGPDSEVMHRLVINRMAAVFRYRKFDPKWLFRLIMNSKTYQRDIRSIDKPEEYFTAVRPSRLRPYQVLASVERITGKNKNIRRAVNQTFQVNPSLPQRDLEGSIQQALLMMNDATLQATLKNSPLKKRLVNIRSSEQLARELYLGVLARTPTDRETKRTADYLKRVNNKAVAVDDLIWVLVNSTEFITKR